MSANRGFTLLEVLLATALMATMLAIALASVQGTTRAAASAEVRSAQQDRVRTVHAFLRRQWAGALPQPVTLPAQPEALRLLTLSADRLVLVGELPGYLARGGVYQQTYRLQRGPRGLQLVFSYAPMTADAVLDPPRPPEVLLDGLAEARFEARGFGPDGRPEAFAPRWERLGQLPVQLRLQVRFPSSRDRFPELRVPLRFSNAPVLAIGGEGGGDSDGDDPT